MVDELSNQPPPAGIFPTGENVPVPCDDSRATSLSLLERAKEADQDAWRVIVDLYSPLVADWCRRFGLDADAAADVSQDAFLVVYRKLADFRKGPTGSFRGWLKSIARTKVMDRHRKDGRSPRADELAVEVAEPATVSAADDADTERKWLLRRALDMIRQDFRPQTWTSFWRVMIDEVPVSEVATEVGLSANAVSLAKARVLTRLKETFGELVDGWERDPE